jgi:hypothetical protein
VNYPSPTDVRNSILHKAAALLAEQGTHQVMYAGLWKSCIDGVTVQVLNDHTVMVDGPTLGALTSAAAQDAVVRYCKDAAAHEAGKFDGAAARYEANQKAFHSASLAYLSESMKNLDKLAAKS